MDSIDFFDILGSHSRVYSVAQQDGIDIGRRESDALSAALRKAATDLVLVAEHYPDAKLPTPLVAAIVALKAAL